MTEPHEPIAGLPVLRFAAPEDWAAWVQDHLTDTGAWLMFAKRGAATATISYQQALTVALCYGWIDSQKRAYDAQFWLQRFTPRGPQSIWSLVNREQALALIASGQMLPAGLATIERAKANGRWEAAYAGQRTAAVPPDLQAALDADPAAAAHFATLSGANRYAILFRVQNVKKAETRARKIGEYVAMLARGEQIHP